MPRPRLFPSVFAVLSTLALLAGCSSDDGADDSSGSSTPTEVDPGTEGDTEDTGDQPEYEVYDGDVDGFYEVPGLGDAGQPGDLLRVQDLGTSDGRTTLRVLYRSTDDAGRPRAVSGVISYPTGDAPEGGWPVVSTAHGTTGIGSQCAPSRLPIEAPGWGVDGVWAMTDYIGLGPVGERHAYLSRAAEGNAVIDIVRAARQLPEAHASSRWLSVGHSQGGHGALAAHELAAVHAPELELVATASLSPGAMLDRVYDGIDPIVTTILTMMAMYGAADDVPDIVVEDYFSDTALAAAEVFDTGCLDEITEQLIPVVFEGAFVADPRQTEPARSFILANDVGWVAVDDVPLYMASGTLDDRVVIQRVEDLFDRLCQTGQVTELTVFEGADHGSVLDDVAEPVADFLNGALAGDDPVDSCADPEAAKTPITG